ncbi:heterokaryon incompatibility protein-domain-containing protein [Paraphoma chrysanthemicola]|nr:heterokaryon incompatibility protein-domain-containing protein [Paraphoma chrysanthemicola]
MNSNSSDVYTALNEPDKTIRLIRILSTEPHVCCELKVVSVETAPIFSALSYVWGDASITDTVYLDDQPVQVTTSLVNALRDVIRHWIESDYTDDGDEQWLWADAICINQSNIEEKNHQVPLMAKIYSGAARVFSWLGVESKKGCAGIDAINLISNEISRLPGVEILLSHIEDGSFDPLTIEDLKKENSAILESATSVTWLVEHHTTGSASNPAAKYFESVHQLFDLPYWSRIWVFQEMVLAQKVVFICGKTTTEWVTVCTVLLWILAFRECHSPTDRPDEVDAKDWFALVLFEQIVARGTRISHARWTLKRLQLSKSNPTSLHEYEFAMMATFLSIGADAYRATDAKDYVYGMRAVVGSRIRTDYTPEQTVAQVYQDYVREWFESIVGAPGQQLGNAKLCNLWFLAIAGVGFPIRSVPALPSWAPNFVGAAELDTNEINTFRRGVYKYDEGVFPSTTAVPRLLDSVLNCTAAMMADIDAIGPIIKSEQVWEGDIEAHLWLLWLYKCFVNLESYVGHGEGYIMFKDIVHALSMTGEVSTVRERQLYERLLMIDIEYACDISMGVPRENFYDSLGLEPVPIALQPAQSHQERVLQHYHEAIMDWSSDGMTIQARRAQRSIWRTMMGTANGLRMAQLDHRYCGLFPPLIQKGDTLAIIGGHRQPVVLRKTGRNYTFVGACRVPMLLHTDKTKELLRLGQARLEEINII